jgi:hypothetical protein
VILADLSISLFFVIVTDLLTPIFFNNHTPHFLHCLPLNPLNTTPLLSNRPICTLLLTLQGVHSNSFPLVIGRITKGFYFRRLNNLKFSKISLNFRGSKTPTTVPKFANLFTEINRTVCKHNAEQNSQLSGHCPTLKLSRPEEHG